MTFPQTNKSNKVSSFDSHDVPVASPIESDEEIDLLDVNEDAPPFSAAEVDITPTQLSVFNIGRRIKFGELDLEPNFQRGQNIWDRQRQSRLVESLMLGIPVSSFYFTDEKSIVDGVPTNKWQVVDGLQRLCSIRNFMIGIPDEKNRKLKLSGLEYLRQYDGKTFDEIPPPVQRTVEEAQLTVFVIRASTPSAVKFNIFKRLNTGGVPLSQQEIRHALNQGPAADFLRDMADSTEFRMATGNRVGTRRMADREYVNRFLAFFVQDVREYQDMDSFLNQALKVFARKSKDEQDFVRREFLDTLSLFGRVFKEHAFSRIDMKSGMFLKPINKALFEVLTSETAKLSANARDRLERNPETTSAFRSLLADESEEGLSSVVGISTGRTSRVVRRHEIIRDFLEKLTGERP